MLVLPSNLFLLTYLLDEQDMLHFSRLAEMVQVHSFPRGRLDGDVSILVPPAPCPCRPAARSACCRPVSSASPYAVCPLSFLCLRPPLPLPRHPHLLAPPPGLQLLCIAAATARRRTPTTTSAEVPLLLLTSLLLPWTWGSDD